MSRVKWILDAAHSELSFKIKHLMISTVTGNFKTFNVIVETEENDFVHPLSVELNADADSISTNNEQRDTHLKSADFFDAAFHKQIHFESTGYDGDEKEGKLTGNLTIRGNTKTILLDVEAGGIVVDPYSQTKAGFTLSGKISRKEFGLVWDAVTETGGIVVSDEVKIHADIQLIKQS